MCRKQQLTFKTRAPLTANDNDAMAHYDLAECKYFTRTEYKNDVKYKFLKIVFGKVLQI